MHYLRTAVASTTGEIRKLFGWRSRDVDLLMERLASESRLQRGVQIEGLEGEYLVSVP